MARKIAPSTRKAQEVSQWLEGQCEIKSGEEVLMALLRHGRSSNGSSPRPFFRISL
jgi:hypothetical protein